MTIRRLVRGFAAAALAIGTMLPATAFAQNFQNEGTVNDGDANGTFSSTASDGDNIDLFNTEYFESQPDQTNELINSSVDNDNDDVDFDFNFDDDFDIIAASDVDTDLDIDIDD